MEKTKYEDFINELSLQPYKDRKNDIAKWLWDTRYSHMMLRESKIAIEYFFDESSTLRSIGKNYGVTPERVRQILCKIMRKLKHEKNKESLLGYLDADFKALVLKRDELEKPLKDIYAKIENYHKNRVLAKYVNDDTWILELSIRAQNALKQANIKTVAELCALSEKDLLTLRHFGKKSLPEIKEFLAFIGLSLKQIEKAL